MRKRDRDGADLQVGDEELVVRRRSRVVVVVVLCVAGRISSGSLDWTGLGRKAGGMDGEEERPCAEGSSCQIWRASSDKEMAEKQ